MRAKLKYVSMGCGAQRAVELGISVMLQLCVNNLDMINVGFIFLLLYSISFSTSLAFSPRLQHYSLSSATRYFYLMDDIDCHGNETLINQCHHRSVYNHYCYKEAGVMCNSKFCFMSFSIQDFRVLHYSHSKPGVQ